MVGVASKRLPIAHQLRLSHVSLAFVTAVCLSSKCDFHGLPSTAHPLRVQTASIPERTSHPHHRSSFALQSADPPQVAAVFPHFSGPDARLRESI